MSQGDAPLAVIQQVLDRANHYIWNTKDIADARVAAVELGFVLTTLELENQHLRNDLAALKGSQ